MTGAMQESHDEVAIVLADITGSTPLYEAEGDTAAMRQVTGVLDRLRSIAEREGGTFIRSRGDDLLCTFTDPAAALRAARLMLFQLSFGPLAVHAGIHFGQVIRVGGDVFGDAVNLTARLAASAKPGELLASRSLLDQVPTFDRQSFQALDAMMFKGRQEATDVFSFQEDFRADNTQMVPGEGASNRRTGQTMVAILRHGMEERRCHELKTLSIGRSPDCDLVIGQPWISRRHATLSVRRGKVQLDDQSSSGTYVTIAGEETFLRRETTLLTGAGTISLARRLTDTGAEIIHFEIVRS
jgi:adenylate cyclase